MHLSVELHQRLDFSPQLLFWELFTSFKMYINLKQKVECFQVGMETRIFISWEKLFFADVYFVFIRIKDYNVGSVRIQFKCKRVLVKKKVKNLRFPVMWFVNILHF